MLRRAIALSYALTPLAGVGLFVGLSALTVTLARAEGVQLHSLALVRAMLLCAAGAWSIRLAYTRLRQHLAGARLARSLSFFALAVAGVIAAWIPFVYRV